MWKKSLIAFVAMFVMVACGTTNNEQTPETPDNEDMAPDNEMDEENRNQNEDMEPDNDMNDDNRNQNDMDSDDPMDRPDENDGGGLDSDDNEDDLRDEMDKEEER